MTTQQQSVWRLRIVAVCLCLVALAFLQDPGLIAIDTKVDLAVNPGGWLDRAIHVWDPSGTFGQLQNQAYGYLWPMGPFFLLGKLLAVPAWVVQRLWWSALLIIAFTGVVKLAERLGIGTGWSRILAGVAFALSPRLLTELGPISVEAWPSAIAPWVLVPLIGLRHGVPLRRAVTRSALIVACAGGVNATAVLAVVPLAAIWLLGLHPLRQRVRALAAWGLAVACATAWWVVPLLMLGRFSPPFLDYIETAGVTTTPTDAVTTLRGASHWHAYLGGAFGPPWSAGWSLAMERPLIVATLVVAGLGLIGLARRGMPYRWFLITGLALGVALVGLGHLGAVPGLFAEQQQAFLDAAGAPLRNVHKFDVVLRLPLVLGLAHLVGLVLRASRDVAGRWRAGLVSGVAVVAVAAVASPALAGGLAAPGGFAEVPGYWKQAATWLNQHSGDEHVLVVPGARFPRYLWGSPSDEITQPLLAGRWGVRSSIPLTPPATIRLLDTIESALNTGNGSRGLADLLSRSGVRYLLLRSDLDYGKSGATQPVIARQALFRSAGLRPVTGFGPWVGGGTLPGTVVDDGLDVSVRALEVWQVERNTRPVVAYDASALTTVVGGPESLLTAAASGVLPAAPGVLAGDRPADQPAGPALRTDGLRRKEVSFGRAHDSASATMQAGEQGRLGAPARDYLSPRWDEKWETTARYLGVESVTASSSFADAAPLSGARPGFQPFAALDGDLASSWRSAPGTIATGQWLEVRLPAAKPIKQVQLAFDLGADSVPTRVSVIADGNKPVTQDVSGSAATIALPASAPSKNLRIRIDDVLDVRLGFGGVGIAELTVPGVRAQRTLVIPPVAPAEEPATVVLSAAPATSACYYDSGRPLCSGDLARASEDGPVIDRTVTLPADARYDITVLARPRPGAALNALLDPGGAAVTTKGITPSVTASSIGVPEPAARPGAAVDGDPGTVWYAAGEDKHPWLRLRWPARRWITGLRMTLPPDAAAAKVWQVTAMGDDDVRNGFLDDGGTFTFDEPMHTDEVTVLLADTVPARSFDPYRNVSRQLPPGVGEIIALPGDASARADARGPVALPCGSGPTVEINGVRRTTALRAGRRDLAELREVSARVCGTDSAKPVGAVQGETRIIARASAIATASQVALTPAVSRTGGQGGGTPESATGLPTPLRVDEWGPTKRRVHLDAYPNQRVLALRENTNAGWRATVGGQTLRPLVLDGWQQGWVVPAGVSGEVEMRFAPGRGYASALVIGAVLLLGLLVVTLIPARRRSSFTQARNHRVLATVVGGLALLVVGGIAAAGVALLLVAATVVLRATAPHLGDDDRRQLRRRLRLAGRWLPAGLFAVAGWLTVTRGGHTAAAPQLLTVAAVVLLWVSLLLGGRRRWESRWKGRSTT